MAIGLKQIDVLACLIDGRAESMSKRDIIACAWRGQVVSDGNLSQQIFNLRQALTPLGGGGLIITTTNGYRFVGEVATVLAAPDRPPAPAVHEPELAPGLLAVATGGAGPPQLLGRRGATAWGAGGLVALAAMIGLALVRPWTWSDAALPRLSIAVLPFRDRSDGGAHAPLADAITDDLTTDLAHIPGSVVVARASVEALRNPFQAVAEIGRKLRVRYLITGSVRAEDAIDRVNATAIEAATGQLIWSTRFELPAGSASDTQTMIVRRIASALDAALTLYVGAQALRDRTDAPTANDLFIEARALLERNDSRAGFDEAQALLERAIRLDAADGDTLALLGLTLVLKTRSTDDRTAQADLARASQVIEAALQLPSPSALALSAKARLAETLGDCRQGEAEARIALMLDADAIDAQAVLARCAANAGRLEEAASYEQTALRLNPFSVRNRPRLLFLSEVRLLQGQYADAIELAQQATVGDEPPAPGAEGLGRAEFAQLILIGATELNGDTAGAAELYRAYAAIWPHRSVWRINTYEPVRMSRLPGYMRYLDALHAAGMPVYADEHAISGAPDGAADSEFAGLPASIPGVRTIETAELADILAQRSAAVFDVGIGAAVPVGATFVADPDRLGPLVKEQVASDRAKPVVILASGCFGAAGYSTITRLKMDGVHNLWWYRGGEEAWAEAGRPSEDRRLEY